MILPYFFVVDTAFQLTLSAFLIIMIFGKSENPDIPTHIYPKTETPSFERKENCHDL